MIDLDRIERYCAEATPGPWEHDGKGNVGHVGEPVCCGRSRAVCDRIDERTGECVSWHEECCGSPDVDMQQVAQSSPQDAAWIANASLDLPALVQRCRELEAALRDAEPHIGLVRHGFGDEVRAIRRHVNALLTFIPNEDANG